MITIPAIPYVYSTGCTAPYLEKRRSVRDELQQYLVVYLSDVRIHEVLLLDRAHRCFRERTT
jgi:hypothetical protein